MTSLQKATITAASGVLLGVVGATLLQAQTPKAGPGYVIAEFNVRDQDAFRDYGQRVPATLSQYGGRFLVRGGKVESLKGDEPKAPVVVLAFESVEQARKWGSSPEYGALVPLRDKAADARIFIVEGLAPSP
jgi:uncharacterized protein (DUF1330 family)